MAHLNPVNKNTAVKHIDMSIAIKTILYIKFFRRT